MSTLTITQLAPVLAAARMSYPHHSEPSWMYVLNYWDSRNGSQRDALLPDADHGVALETLRFYADRNPHGEVPPRWARIPAVQLNPVPAAPDRLRMRAGSDVMEIDVIAALELAQSLPFILSLLAAPALAVDTVKGETTCPHCGTVRVFDAEPAVREVDISIRWNEGNLRVADADDDERDDIMGGRDLVLDISQADAEHETIAHICNVCSKPVTLPAGIESFWS